MMAVVSPNDGNSHRRDRDRDDLSYKDLIVKLKKKQADGEQLSIREEACLKNHRMTDAKSWAYKKYKM